MESQGKEYGMMLFAEYMEEVGEEGSKDKVCVLSFEGFLQMAMEFNLFKIPSQSLFLNPET